MVKLLQFFTGGYEMEVCIITQGLHSKSQNESAKGGSKIWDQLPLPYDPYAETPVFQILTWI